MTNAIDDLYTVADGVDDVVADDHNTLVAAAQYTYDCFGGTYNFGNGRDGNLKLGAIANPTVSNTITPALGGAGLLTGTFLYKYQLYNLSGKTLPTNGSVSVVASNNKVNLTIPAQASNTNVTGYEIFRSGDGGSTYYYVGKLPVDDATQQALFVDNVPVTSGTAPSGSNTTGNTVTAGGVFYCKDFTLSSGQTITVDHTSIGFIVISNGNITVSSGATINGNNRFNSGNGTSIGSHHQLFGAFLTNVHHGAANYFLNYQWDQNTGANYGFGTTTSHTPPSASGYGTFNTKAYSEQALTSSQMWFNGQGAGVTEATASASSPDNPGASVVLICKDILTVGGTITCNAIAQTDGQKPPAAGGLIYLVGTQINRSGATLSADGGAAVAGNFTAPTSSGAGGGVIFYIADFIYGTATATVNGGAAAAANGSGVGAGTSGASFGGKAGTAISAGSAGNAGGAGQIITKTPSQIRLLRF